MIPAYLQRGTGGHNHLSFSDTYIWAGFLQKSAKIRLYAVNGIIAEVKEGGIRYDIKRDRG